MCKEPHFLQGIGRLSSSVNISRLYQSYYRPRFQSKFFPFQMNDSPKSHDHNFVSSSPSSRRKFGSKDTPDVKLSKLLSRILRHAAKEEKIPIRNDGFVLVDDLLKHHKFQAYRLQDIERVVVENDKQRFALDTLDGKWYIRANQGHSIDLEVDLTPLLKAADFPQNVIHGTNAKCWELIRKSGLSRMKRNHIHFASAIPSTAQVISGARASSTVFIYIDVPSALQAGIKFFQAANQVILSPGNEAGIIPTSLFLRVEDRAGRDLLKT